MACRLFGAKPLPELMMTYGQLDLRNKVQWKLYGNYNIFIDVMAFQNVVCQVGGHLVPASMCFKCVSWALFPRVKWLSLPHRHYIRYISSNMHTVHCLLCFVVFCLLRISCLRVTYPTLHGHKQPWTILLNCRPTKVWYHNRDLLGHGLSQWETTFYCNVVSYWLSLYGNDDTLITKNNTRPK